MGPVPTSTYRLQITAAFDLHAAARTLPYLHDLGVDWVYLSPLLAAEPGSEHGYDVVDPSRIDPARGGAEGLAALSAEARRLGMGVLVDIVPNHVGVASPEANAWWQDVLQHGRDSAYAGYFDVDWDAGGGAIRSGEQDLNYRRFFTITSLAALRVEERAVFEASHVEIRRWIRRRPRRRSAGRPSRRTARPEGLPRRPGRADRWRLRVVEKILEPGERLPQMWATAGTTGYDALALVDRVLTDPAGEEPLSALAARLGAPTDWPALVHDTKRAVADGPLRAEVRRIVRDLMDVEGGGRTRPEPPSIVDAVAELMACFPVYRSYLPEGRAHLDHAFAAAHRRRPDLTAAFDRVRPLLRDPTHPAALRFQQTSGMVMAKGVEDSAFYRYPRLTSLNEVGGDPSVFSISVEEFHAAMRKRQADWPHAMTVPDHARHQAQRGHPRPDRGARRDPRRVGSRRSTSCSGSRRCPIPASGPCCGRRSSARGRHRATGCTRTPRRPCARPATAPPGPSPDAAVRGRRARGRRRGVRRRAGGRDPRRALRPASTGPRCSNALAAKLVALTMPGVPDVYQGTELWDQSLVDPDNRRPVDFAHRAAVLDGAEDPAWLKLAVVLSALTLRRDRPELFTTYAPVAAAGEAADHVLAFDRGRCRRGRDPAAGRPGGARLGRHRARAADRGPGPTCSPARPAAARVGDLLASYPVALLVQDA